jgi:hypothetical protein
MAVHFCHPSDGRKSEQEDWDPSQLEQKKQDPNSKISRVKRAGDTAQAVEHLPSVFKLVQSSGPPKKKKKS